MGKVREGWESATVNRVEAHQGWGWSQVRWQSPGISGGNRVKQEELGVKGGQQGQIRGQWRPMRTVGWAARGWEAPMSLPALQPPCPSADSRARILKEASGVEPGWVEIMPRKRVTDHVRTWLLSAQTEGQGGSRSGWAAVAQPSPAPGEPALKGLRILPRIPNGPKSCWLLLQNHSEPHLASPCLLPPAAPVHLISYQDDGSSPPSPVPVLPFSAPVLSPQPAPHAARGSLCTC